MVEKGNTCHWRVAYRTGMSPVQMVLSPDRSLQQLPDAGSWKSSGERSCFRLSVERPDGVLPAGWYEVAGELQSLDSAVLSPCLYADYVNGMDGNWQIPLPDPDEWHRVRSLVLFKYDVTRLRFSPGHGPATFRMHGFQLRRVSPSQALMRMLAQGSLDGDGETTSLASRSLGFVAGSCAGILVGYRPNCLATTTGAYLSGAAATTRAGHRDTTP